MPIKIIRDFLRLESAGGILLVAAAAVAMLLANSPIAALYDGFLATPVEIRIGDFQIAKPLLLWINDGLMAVFFLLIGLELKREMLEGRLSSYKQVMLPAIAAVGGMVVPAAVYYFLNRDDAVALQGWAIPTATDIAFALGVLSLLGNRVPASLKLFLVTLAILDDVGAIVIIALFYTSDLSGVSLTWAAVALLALFALNRRGVVHLAAYVLVGIVLWVSVLKSGVHATLAGVALAFAIPLRTGDRSIKAPLLQLEHSLHPWVAYGILPLFAFANSGVSLAGMSLAQALAPVPLGIALGLFLGKQLGVFVFSWITIKLRIAKLPEGANWWQLYGVAVLCGIGFTMSLFIGSLAFDQTASDYSTVDRLGILMGSVVSATVGYFILRFTPRR
ncbi:MAG: Na+/H+ antiporter NhaA [Gammaproteobacteria bacterium]|nr:Na+/H+ antiporter NhaA [Gammaproteobacteria bacterium]MDH3407116.1 Na+/H+ antiporter NhaA [Gammaproteobacteria bacterium]MDH3563704.1 Na+/H+ antiporter NhaA [Gammaproteobacteria bacterium]